MGGEVDLRVSWLGKDLAFLFQQYLFLIKTPVNTNYTGYFTENPRGFRIFDCRKLWEVKKNQVVPLHGPVCASVGLHVSTICEMKSAAKFIKESCTAHCIVCI